MAVDCLLVHVPKLLEHHPHSGWRSRINFLSMGIFSIAEELTNRSLRTRIVHLGVEKQLDPSFKLADRVQAEAAPVVAFALHWHPQTYDTIEAARQLKARAPETQVVLGGLTASFFARQILERYDFVDAVIRGEAERPLAQYVDAVVGGRGLDQVENLSWRDHGEIREQPITFTTGPAELNGWRFEAFDLLDHHETYRVQNWSNSWEPELKFHSQPRQPTLFGAALGRGCTGTCTWCAGSFASARSATGRQKTAWRSAERIAETVTRIRGFGFKRIYTCFDPTPNGSRELHQILEALGGLSPRVPLDFECFGLPSPELVEAFAQHLDPSSRLIISPETFDEGLRRRHRAFYFSNTELESTLEHMQRVGVASELYFVIGLPGETRENIEAMAAWQADLRTRYSGVKQTPTWPLEMEPNSPWHLHPERHHLTLRHVDVASFHEAHGRPDYSLGYDLEGLSEDEILRLHQQHFPPGDPKLLDNMRKYWLANQRDYSAVRVHS